MLPDEYLNKVIKEKGISRKDLARILGKSYTGITKILNGKAPLTSEMAVIIQQSLNLDYEDIKKVMTEQAIKKAEDDLAATFKKAEIRDHNAFVECKRKLDLHRRYDISDMINKGLIRDSNNLLELEEDIMLNLGFRSREDIYNSMPVIYPDSDLTQQEAEVSLKAHSLRVWENSLYQIASRQETPEYDSIKLEEFIKKITTEVLKSKDWVNIIIETLKECGISLIFAEKFQHMPQYHSGFFWMNYKAFIVYFTGKNSIDHFLYAILHQIGHIKARINWDRTRREYSNIFWCSFQINKDSMIRERAANDILKKTLNCYEEIEFTYREVGHDVEKTVKALPDIPKPVIYGHFKWFRAHYRHRKYKEMPRLIDVLDPKYLRYNERG